MKQDDDLLIQEILMLIGDHADKHGKALKLLKLDLDNKLHPQGMTIEWKYPKVKKNAVTK